MAAGVQRIGKMWRVPFAGLLLRIDGYRLLAMLLWLGVAIQLARLAWLWVTPLGPIGDWKTPAALRPPVPAVALDAFDPFFRLAPQAAPAAVTSLNLKLYGVREDRATGRGSAIIGLPSGEQRSFAVGEELMPGVTLTAVGFDNVTISSNGTPEQIFLDQSTPAATPPAGAAPAVGAPPPAPPPPSAAPPVPTLQAPPQPSLSNLQLAPVANGIRVDPGPNAALFQAAGFAPGDVITQVDGQPVTSVQAARQAIQNAGGNVAVTVNRGGRPVSLQVRLAQ